jgi:DNA-binding GntR family transcriptional regulator
MMEDPRVYIRISEDLRKQIADGTLEAGQKAPSIDELRKQYDVGARFTVAKALHILEESNLLVRIPGHGYYVVSE